MEDRPGAIGVCLWVVTEENEQQAAPTETEPAPEGPTSEPAEQEQVSLTESRFLYVGVAAKRAKQLRRGALPRLKELAPDPETGEVPAPRSKLERVAMREVDDGLIVYRVPDPKPPGGDGT